MQPRVMSGALPMLPGPVTPPKPRVLLRELPETLAEPMFYLSRLQRSVLLSTPGLEGFADDLPGWVPYRSVSAAFGHDVRAIAAASKDTGRPFVWAPELENARRNWYYIEHPLRIRGKVYNDIERYIESNGATASTVIEGIDAKLRASPEVVSLLMSTRDHPLVFVGEDDVMGIDHRTFCGQNVLGSVYASYREEFSRRVSGGAASVWDEPVLKTE